MVCLKRRLQEVLLLVFLSEFNWIVFCFLQSNNYQRHRIKHTFSLWWRRGSRLKFIFQEDFVPTPQWKWRVQGTKINTDVIMILWSKNSPVKCLWPHLPPCEEFVSIYTSPHFPLCCRNNQHSHCKSHPKNSLIWALISCFHSRSLWLFLWWGQAGLPYIHWKRLAGKLAVYMLAWWEHAGAIGLFLCVMPFNLLFMQFVSWDCTKIVSY